MSGGDRMAIYPYLKGLRSEISGRILWPKKESGHLVFCRGNFYIARDAVRGLAKVTAPARERCAWHVRGEGFKPGHRL